MSLRRGAERRVVVAVVAGLCVRAWAQPVTIVDIIPQANSAETLHQAEPSLAVDPANPQTIFATTFSDPSGSGNSPLFRTTLGGDAGTWSVFQTLSSSDWTINYSPAGGTCYMSRLAGAGIMVDKSVGGAAFSNIAAGTFSGSADQPHMNVGRSGGQDRLYVSFNDIGHTPQSASVHYSLNGGTSWSGASPARLETGTPTGIAQDAPPVDVAFASSGRAYAAFVRPSATVGASPFDMTASLVIKRDDNNATPAFNNLGTGGAGVIPPQMSGIRMPWLLTQVGSGTGTSAQRARSSLSLAVDPNNQDRVAVAYPDAINGTLHLHVLLSNDAGATWTEPMAPITGGGIPALSFASNGAIGVLFQQWDGTTQSTHLRQSSDGLVTTTDVTLSSWLGSTITNSHPYLGDYYDLESVNGVFYGIFSGSNDPSLPVWASPSLDVHYARFVNGPLGAAGTTLRATAGGVVVGTSLDPFFFHVPAVPGPGGLTVLALAGLGATRRRRA
jgi:hypothetical protein